MDLLFFTYSIHIIKYVFFIYNCIKYMFVYMLYMMVKNYESAYSFLNVYYFCLHSTHFSRKCSRRLLLIFVLLVIKSYIMIVLMCKVFFSSWRFHDSWWPTLEGASSKCSYSTHIQGNSTYQETTFCSQNNSRSISVNLYALYHVDTKKPTCDETHWWRIVTNAVH